MVRIWNKSGPCKTPLIFFSLKSRFTFRKLYFNEASVKAISSNRLPPPLIPMRTAQLSSDLSALSPFLHGGPFSCAPGLVHGAGVFMGCFQSSVLFVDVSCLANTTHSLASASAVNPRGGNSHSPSPGVQCVLGSYDPLRPLANCMFTWMSCHLSQVKSA